MRAITYTKFGSAADVLTLADLPTPSPATGEVLIRVHTSGVNPSDVKARAGGRPGVTKPPFPMITPHSDGAGIIEAVGEGVPQSRVGERVWIWNGQWQRPFGTAAEYIVLPQDQAVQLADHNGGQRDSHSVLLAELRLGASRHHVGHLPHGVLDVVGQRVVLLHQQAARGRDGEIFRQTQHHAPHDIAG